MTFRIIPLRAAFDTWIGVTNLGWLISFVSELTALYVMACGSRALPRYPVPRWLHPYVAITLLIFTFIFVTHLSAGPERLEYTTAQNQPELIFLVTKYVGVAIITAAIGLSFVRLYRKEQHKIARLRLGMLCIVALTASFYGMTRTTFVSLAYFCPTSPLLDILRLVEKGSQILICLAWPLAYILSSKSCLTIRRPFERMQKSNTLRDLREIQTALAGLGLSSGWSERPLPQKISLDLQIYRALISILDGKRLLLANLRTIERPASDRRIHWPAPNTGRLRRVGHTPSRDDGFIEQARQIQRLVEIVDDDLPYYEMVAAYRKVGRILRRGKILPAVR
ncbi:MAG TPA: hypothetical protein ENN19_13370 [Chloroflexi bacterium]|nr:hypothetical protein [Chloroflexota bacterium]